MTPTTPTNIGNSDLGRFGKFDVYPVLWQETACIADHRQTANTLYISVNSLLISLPG